MRKVISLILSLLLLFAAHNLFSQIDGGAFNSTGSGYSVVNLTDYQSLGVNPANLGWKRNSHTTNLGFVEFGMSIYSEPLSKKLVFTDLLGSGEDFNSQVQRDEAIRNFTNSELLIQLTNTLLGFSYQDEKVGGFAFALRQKIYWHSTNDWVPCSRATTHPISTALPFNQTAIPSVMPPTPTRLPNCIIRRISRTCSTTNTFWGMAERWLIRKISGFMQVLTSNCCRDMAS